jgi:hypothetical protein
VLGNAYNYLVHSCFLLGLTSALNFNVKCGMVEGYIDFSLSIKFREMIPFLIHIPLLFSSVQCSDFYNLFVVMSVSEKGNLQHQPLF